MINEKIEYYKLRDILIEDNQEKISEFLKEIKVRKYIPIKEKYEIISYIKNSFIDKYINLEPTIENLNTDYIFMRYEIKIKLEVLFYYTNISIPESNVDIIDYDLIMNSSFYDYVLGICGRDCDDFIKQCDKTINLNSVFILNSLSKIFDDVISPDDVKGVVESLNGLDKDKLEILKAVEMYNNPLLAGKIENIKG